MLKKLVSIPYLFHSLNMQKHAETGCSRLCTNFASNSVAVSFSIFVALALCAGFELGFQQICVALELGGLRHQDSHTFTAC